MKKISIAFFITNLGSGGAEKQLVGLLTGLNKEMFKIDLFLYAYQTELFFDEIYQVQGINIIKRRINSSVSIIKILSSIYYIRKALQKNNYDLICSSLFLNNLLVRIAAGIKFRKRVIISIRTSFELYDSKLLFIEKLLMPGSTIVFNSMKTKNDFELYTKGKFSNRFHVIYNGYSCDDIYKTTTGESEMVSIGGLGRQTTYKNFSQVVRVFLALCENINYKIKLVLQGSEGNDTGYINNLLSSDKNFERVILEKANRDINSFFNRIQIFILPSLFEGCPNVLFEALLRKKLCIVSQGANSDNFIQNGRNGLVYDGTDEGLRNAISKAISIVDSNEGLVIMENAFRYAVENFSIESMVNKYEHLFLQIHEKNKSSYKSKINSSLSRPRV